MNKTEAQQVIDEISKDNSPIILSDLLDLIEVKEIESKHNALSNQDLKELYKYKTREHFKGLEASTSLQDILGSEGGESLSKPTKELFQFIKEVLCA